MGQNIFDHNNYYVLLSSNLTAYFVELNLILYKLELYSKYVLIDLKIFPFPTLFSETLQK